MRKAISGIVLAAFISTSVKSPAYAQTVYDNMLHLPAPGVMVHLSPEFTPAVLKGIVIHPEDAFKFDFIVYKGDQEFTKSQKKEEYTKLIKYFLASLAIPDEDQWVNLSPYEKDRIIKDDFGKTEMGRDLLAQDYLLKQITASLIYPQDKLGQKFWNEIYSRAYKQFGTTNIPVNTFNKVWIIPDEADIYEKGNVAYLYKSHLKVMLEEDYLAMSKHAYGGVAEGGASPASAGFAEHAGEARGQDPDISRVGSQIVREIVIPELTREVNEDKNFAPLRQVFSGMILAAWYKRALRESLLGKIYANKGKLKGVDQDPKNNEAIYQQYLKAYKKGVFNFIKEDADRYTHEMIPRKYFSGGTALVPLDAAMDSYHRPILKFMRIDLPDAAMKTAADFRSGNPKFDLATTSVDPSQTGAGILFRQAKAAPSDAAMRGQVYLDTSDFNSRVPRDGLFALTDALIVSAAIRKQVDQWKERRDVKGRMIGRVIFDPTKVKRSSFNNRDEDYDRYVKMGPVMRKGIINGLIHRIVPKNLKGYQVSRFSSGGIFVQPIKQGALGESYRSIQALLKGSIPIVENGLKAMAQKNRWSSKTITFRELARRLLLLTAMASALLAQQKGTATPAANGPAKTSQIAKKPAAKTSLARKHIQKPQIKFLSKAEFDDGSLLEVGPEYTIRFNGGQEIKITVTKIQLLTGPHGELVYDFHYTHRGAQHWVFVVAPQSKDSVFLQILLNFFPPRGPVPKTLKLDEESMTTAPGGIDLNAAHLRMNIKRDGHGVVLPVSQQNLDDIHIDGLVPIILEITPAGASPVLAELTRGQGL